MIAKKKGLYLGLLLLLLGVGNIMQAYFVTLENGTEKDVKFIIKFNRKALSDRVTVLPSHEDKFYAPNQPISVDALVYKDGIEESPKKWERVRFKGSMKKINKGATFRIMKMSGTGGTYRIIRSDTVYRTFSKKS